MLTAIFIVLVLILIVLMKEFALELLMYIVMGLMIIIVEPYQWISERISKRKEVPFNYSHYSNTCRECGGLSHMHYEGCSHFR
jgi:uncharacterized membrane protein YjdF